MVNSNKIFYVNYIIFYVFYRQNICTVKVVSFLIYSSQKTNICDFKITKLKEINEKNKVDKYITKDSSENTTKNEEKIEKFVLNLDICNESYFRKQKNR